MIAIAELKALRQFNDIEFHDKLVPPDEALLAKPVPGLMTFAEHGSGSQYATFDGHVVWLDSEGALYVIARNMNEFVDALHLYAGFLYDVMASCQASTDRSLDILKKEFDASAIEAGAQFLRDDGVYQGGFALFEAWAKKKGRSIPTDLVERSTALRPLARRLREASGAGA